MSPKDTSPEEEGVDADGVDRDGAEREEGATESVYHDRNGKMGKILVIAEEKMSLS